MQTLRQCGEAEAVEGGLALLATVRGFPSGFWDPREKLWTPVEKSNWLISSLRLLSAMYDWEERYTGASVVHDTGPFVKGLLISRHKQFCKAASSDITSGRVQLDV